MTNREIIRRVLSDVPEILNSEKSTVTAPHGNKYEQLVKFLEVVPYEQMLQVISLMYYGRDGEKFELVWHESSRNFWRSSEIATFMLTKMPRLSEYFHEAEVKATAAGFDIDAPPIPVR